MTTRNVGIALPHVQALPVDAPAALIPWTQSLNSRSGVDPLEIDRRHAEVAVAELALDDVQRHALAQQLERMRVTQLVRRESPSHTCVSRPTMQHRARRRGAPRATARAAVDHAEQRADRHLFARSQPRLQLLEAPVVHADFATPAAFAAPHKQRATTPVKIELGQIKRLLDAQPRAPEHGDQTAGA